MAETLHQALTEYRPFFESLDQEGMLIFERSFRADPQAATRVMQASNGLPDQKNAALSGLMAANDQKDIAEGRQPHYAQQTLHRLNAGHSVPGYAADQALLTLHQNASNPNVLKDVDLLEWKPGAGGDANAGGNLINKLESASTFKGPELARLDAEISNAKGWPQGSTGIKKIVGDVFHEGSKYGPFVTGAAIMTAVVGGSALLGSQAATGSGAAGAGAGGGGAAAGAGSAAGAGAGGSAGLGSLMTQTPAGFSGGLPGAAGSVGGAAATGGSTAAAAAGGGGFLSNVGNFLSGGTDVAGVGIKDVFDIGSGIYSSIQGNKQAEADRNAAFPPEVQALRAQLATTASGLVPQVAAGVPGGQFTPDQNLTNQTSVANEELRVARNNMAAILLQQAERIGALNSQQVGQIRQIAQQTGQTVEQAAQQILGPGGVAQMLQTISDRAPGVIEQTQQQYNQLIQSRPDLKAVASIEEQLGRDPTQGAQQTLQQISGGQPLQLSQDVVSRILSGDIAPGFSGTDADFGNLLAQANSAASSAIQAGQDQIAAFKAQSLEDESEAFKRLKDEFHAVGIGTESGAYREAAARLSKQFANQRQQGVAEITRQAQAQASQEQARAIELGNQINTSRANTRLNAGGQLSTISQGVQQTAAGAATQGAGLGLQQRGQTGDLAAGLAGTALQGAQLFQTGQNLALDGLTTQAALQSQVGNQLVQGGNLALNSGNFRTGALNDTAQLESGLIGAENAARLQSAELPAQTSLQIQDNLRTNEDRLRSISQDNFNNAATNKQLDQSTIQLGLSGQNAGIAALPSVNQLNFNRQQQAQDTIAEGIIGILDKNKKKEVA